MGQIEISIAIIDLESPRKGLTALAEESIAVISRLVSLIEAGPGQDLPADVCQRVTQIHRNFSQAIDIYHNRTDHGRPRDEFEAVVQTLKELLRHIETFEAHFNTLMNAQANKSCTATLADWRECALAALDLKHTLERTVAAF